MERTVDTARSSTPDKPLEGSYLDWAAIVGGAVVAVAVGSVFTAFGAALGLSVISAEPGEGSFNVWLIVTGIWIVISMVASYMAGGYIAGRMRRPVGTATPDEVTARDGMNGLVVWGLGVIVSVVLVHGAISSSLSAAGSVASAAGSAAETVATVAGDVAGGAAQGAVQSAGQDAGATANPTDFLTSTLLRPNQVAAPTAGGGAAPAADYSADAGAILSNVAMTGEISDTERAYLASAVSAQAGIPAAEAATRVDTAVAAAQKIRTDAENLATEAKNQAVEAAEVARISAILTAFLAAATALISAVAAHSGAVKGGKHRDEGRLFGGFAHHGRAR
ncbi:hypothetical protein [Cypionkella sp.]|uniref:hypothetical protein n=1 Tax=Cypionkella sp. TaxID=2811411 RepID=UPI0026059146|nr:hypothetical protein [Cypionkella sp.]MDB5664865.1 hypothetical protein [Cypionkella sp.]